MPHAEETLLLTYLVPAAHSIDVTEAIGLMS
jgi:hypothetical protein